jgi:hypothetical protein
MPKYYIFGSNNICFDIDLKQRNVSVNVEQNRSYIEFEKLKKDLKDLLNYLEQLEKWKKDETQTK